MSPQPIARNTLFYGDNLNILREYIATESVNLIYLDPPFNSNRNYNVLFKDESGTDSEAQITAFEDTWHWNHVAEQTYQELVTQSPDHVSKMITSLREFIGNNQMMAYLVMMTIRLVELHRVLKPTGSLYLHCDPTASHYLKIILDTIFGPRNFRNEIVWQRTSAHNDPNRYGANIDILLYYTKGPTWTWNQLYAVHSSEYLARFRQRDPDGRIWTDADLTAKGLSGGGYEYEYKGIRSLWRCPIETMQKLDAEGRLHFTKAGGIRLKRYLDDTPGIPLQALWDDIPPINSQATERLGYPTQKPLALLERIINASSNPNDIVLDPFCGCGTAIAAAQKLDRKWIGIDITHLSIALQKYRLQAMFPDIQFKVIGEPQDVGAAKQLAQDDRYQFQWWALSLIRAKPLGGQEGSKTGKKGSDKGIDGVITFIDDAYAKPKRVLVQVKSGHVKSGDIRDLVGTVQRENAAMGVFITLETPTREMITEAVSAGYYESPGWNQKYPRIQIRTIAELLRGTKVDMPPQYGTFKQAPKVKQEAQEEQLDLLFE
jgi:site-specific DNA-methyltransferase (adenine-specific)